MADEPSQSVECKPEPEPEPAVGVPQSTCVPKAPEPLRSETVWMPYGDIVLQAELTQFRVNRDILALQSSVFRDMFLVPQPADAPTVDGCPLVHLADDKANEWELLLDLLYDPYISETELTLSSIEVMLSLGRKYDMAKLWKHAVFCIRCDFPKDKSKFDMIQSNVDMPKNISNEAGSEVVLLNLADTHGIRTSIPTLALECLKKYSMLKHYVWLELDNESVIPVDDCSAGDCDADRGKIHRAVMRGRPGERYLLLETWDQLNCNNFVCPPCADAAEERWKADRVVVWGNLPGWFGLPKWKELKDDVQ
uniref:BTB domain-containing protein n=1 Tax=Mycena chlorophos TaxID=658473 RepID=A0ABQ0LXY6_MYCCL|nr:predicted protein [Mycena chlorophos]